MVGQSTTDLTEAVPSPGSSGQIPSDAGGAPNQPVPIKDRKPEQIRRRKAVAVGINNYQPEINQLTSCVNDANLMVNLLINRYGFKQPDIKTLLDADATLPNLKAALDWLMNDASPDDSLVFFFSGHGYRLQLDEVWREAIVLYDGFYFDEDFSQRTQTLPGGVLTTILDACHSGGMEKDLFTASTFSRQLKELGLTHQVELAKVKAYVDPQHLGSTTVQPSGLVPGRVQRPWLQGRPEAQNRDLLYRPFGRRLRNAMTGIPLNKDFDPRAAADPPEANCILFSACTPEQTAAAGTSATKNLSVFTYCMSQVLGSANSPQAEPIQEELIRKVGAQASSLGFSQTPELLLPSPLDWARKRTFLLESSPTSPSQPQVPASPPPTPPAAPPSSPTSVKGALTMLDPQMTQKLSQALGPVGGADKGWSDLLLHVVSAAPQLIGPLAGLISGRAAAAQKDYAPPATSAGAADKGLSDVLLFVANTAPQLIGPLTNLISGSISAAQKDYAPPATSAGAADKGLSDVLLFVANTAPQLIGPLTNLISGSISAAQKDYTPPATSAGAADKGWVNLLLHVATTAPHLLGTLTNLISGNHATAR